MADDAPTPPFRRTNPGVSSWTAVNHRKETPVKERSVSSDSTISAVDDIQSPTPPTPSTPQEQKPSTAADKILASFHSYRERKFPHTAAFYNKMDELTGSPKAPSSPPDSAEPEPTPERDDTATESKKAVKKGAAPRGGNTPRYDRAGNLRPPNKRFLKRNTTTGKLVAPEAGKEDQTQLEEVQDWINNKRHVKFELIPQPSAFTFKDFDPEFVTEPNGLKNQGRRLLLGTNGDTEIWAVMPVSARLYMPRIIQRDVTDDSFTLFAKVKDGDMPELDYPFGAFSNHNKFEEDWMGLNTVIAYVFLMCGEAKIVFSDSSKWPGQLSTAMSRIKQVYAPYDPHPTAATVQAALASQQPAEEDTSVSDAPKRTELDVINEQLEKKRLLQKMTALVSDPSVFEFRNFQAVLQVKNVQNVRNRALFMGESEDTQTWASIYRNPNKAQLSVIVNIDKATGAQKVVQFFPDIPWTLTFPFEAFREKGDALSFRKMQYVIGYIFLSMGEADKALNLTGAIFNHFTNITKTVFKHYESAHPPENSVGVFKPSTPPTCESGNDVPKASRASIPATTGNPRSTIKVHVDPDDGTSTTRQTPKEMPLKQVSGPNGARSTTPTVASPSKGQPAPRPPVYTAPSQFQSVEDLHVSVFLEENINHAGKRRNEDDGENGEDRAAKYLRLDSERSAATKLRVHQAGVTEKAKLALEKAQQTFDKEKRKMELLQQCELDIVAQHGEVTAEMTDEDLEKLARLRKE